MFNHYRSYQIGFRYAWQGRTSDRSAPFRLKIFFEFGQTKRRAQIWYERTERSVRNFEECSMKMGLYVYSRPKTDNTLPQVRLLEIPHRRIISSMVQYHIMQNYSSTHHLLRVGFISKLTGRLNICHRDKKHRKHVWNPFELPLVLMKSIDPSWS